MNRVKAYDGKTPYNRVSKAAARKAFNAGKPVILCPVKLYPFGAWRPSCMIQGDQCSDTFERLLENFIWYNCQLNETGYYAAFYIAEGV